MWEKFSTLIDFSCTFPASIAPGGRSNLLRLLRVIEGEDRRRRRRRFRTIVSRENRVYVLNMIVKMVIDADFSTEGKLRGGSKERRGEIVARRSILLKIGPRM